MTEKNMENSQVTDQGTDEASTMNAKQKARRRLLKAGAAAAPVAMTLSAGNVWATYGGTNPLGSSDGRCFNNLYQTIDDLRQEDLKVVNHRGVIKDFNKTKYWHWRYLKENKSNQHGLSCLASISTDALYIEWSKSASS